MSERSGCWPSLGGTKEPVLAVPGGFEWMSCPVALQTLPAHRGTAGARWCVEDDVGFGLSTSSAHPGP